MITRNVKAVEISRSDADRYNSSFAVKMGNFGTLTELCTWVPNENIVQNHLNIVLLKVF